MAVEIDPSEVSSAEKPSAGVHDAEVQYDGSDTIPLRYRGSITDYKDMNTLGKTQVLWRNFRFFPMCGFASSVMCSWEYELPTIVFGLTDGGTAFIFWGFLIVALAMTLVYASLAELASISPTAGGQYHWVSELTPRKYQQLLSYIVGWLTTIGWQVYLCGASFITAGIIQGLIAFNVRDYEWHNWHATLLTIAIIFGAVFVNVILRKNLPLINGFLLILHFIGFIAVFVTLWAVGPHADAEVLFTFSNGGGWSSTGLSAMVGLITPLVPLVGYDCSVHMSEEIQDASTTLPRSIMFSVAVNSVMGLLMGTAVIFTLGNLDDVLNTTTGQPFIQLFYNTTRSYVATNILTAIVIIMLFGSATSQVAATSRQLWSFARDNGVPAAGWVSRVPPGLDIPLHAIIISVVASSLLACINIGSSAALNAIVSLGVSAVLTSYLVTIGCLIWRRMSGPPLPPRRWSLGRWGLAINIVAELCLVPMWIFIFWPTAVPVTAVTMNWSSTIFGALIIFSLIYFVIRGRHVYHGPVLEVKREE